METKRAEELKLQHENLKQAMADLQIVNEGSATEKILAQTQQHFFNNDTFDDRKEKLQNYKQKLHDANNTKMMSFYALAEKEQEAG